MPYMFGLLPFLGMSLDVIEVLDMLDCASSNLEHEIQSETLNRCVKVEKQRR